MRRASSAFAVCAGRVSCRGAQAAETGAGILSFLRARRTLRGTRLSRAPRRSRRSFILLCGFLSITAAGPSRVNAAAPEPNERLLDFQEYRFGRSPSQFDYLAAGASGPVLAAGRPLWRAYVDPTAPSPKIVLLQASALAEADHYPMALLRDLTNDHVNLAVHFKVLSRTRSQGAGLVWAAQDQQDWLALMASPHDGLIRLVRHERHASVLAETNASWDPAVWNALEVAVRTDRIEAWLNDRPLFQLELPRLHRPGRFGLVTHADAVTVFDDFYIQFERARVRRAGGR